MAAKLCNARKSSHYTFNIILCVVPIIGCGDYIVRGPDTAAAAPVLTARRIRFSAIVCVNFFLHFVSCLVADTT